MQSIEVGQIWRRSNNILWIVEKIEKSPFMESMDKVTLRKMNAKDSGAEIYITAKHIVLNTMNRCREKELIRKHPEESKLDYWQHTIGH
jgi:hypothetical protein